MICISNISLLVYINWFKSANYSITMSYYSRWVICISSLLFISILILLFILILIACHHLFPCYLFNTEETIDYSFEIVLYCAKILVKGYMCWTFGVIRKKKIERKINAVQLTTMIKDYLPVKVNFSRLLSSVHVCYLQIRESQPGV